MIRDAERAKLRQEFEWSLREEGLSFPTQTVDSLLEIFRDRIKAAYNKGLMDAEPEDAEPDEFHCY